MTEFDEKNMFRTLDTFYIETEYLVCCRIFSTVL